MATKASIVSAINSKVGNTKYSIWRIGLTHDLNERKKYWKETEEQNIDHWADWQADSLTDAQDIESYFINQGMKGGTGGDMSARKTTYIYVF